MTCLANSLPALVTTAAPTAIGASDMASFWMLGPPLRDRAAATPPPIIPIEFAGLTTASTARVVMSDLARWICISGARRRVRLHLNTPAHSIAKTGPLGPQGPAMREGRSAEDLLQLLLDLLG